MAKLKDIKDLRFPGIDYQKSVKNVVNTGRNLRVLPAKYPSRRGTTIAQWIRLHSPY